MAFNFQNENLQSWVLDLRLPTDIETPVTAAFLGGEYRATTIGITVIATEKPESRGHFPGWANRVAHAVVLIKKRQASLDVLSIPGNLLRLEVRTGHTPISMASLV